MKEMKAVDILWDVDFDLEGELLPNEVEIPEDIANDPELAEDRGALEETIGCWLSDTYGYCHYGFELEEY